MSSYYFVLKTLMDLIYDLSYKPPKKKCLFQNLFKMLEYILNVSNDFFHYTSIHKININLFTCIMSYVESLARFFYQTKFKVIF